tara:strand:- start:1422 stop:3251 length:1830 start_codon:yes stop_codon:yes gene_type:complete
MSDFIKVLKFVKNYKLLFLLNIILSTISIFFGLFSFTLIIPVLGILFGTHNRVVDISEFEFSVVWLKTFFSFKLTKFIDLYGNETSLGIICLVIILAFFLKNLTRYLSLYSMIPIRTGIIKDIRKLIHEKVIILPVSFFSNKRKGDLLSRMTNDVNDIEFSLVRLFNILIFSPINIILSLILLVIINLNLTLIVLLLFPVAGLVIGNIGRNLKKKSKKGQIQISKIMSAFEENIFGLRIIKIFNAEKIINDRFNEQLILNKKITSSIYKRRDLASPMSEFLSTIVMVFIVWYGGNLIFTGNINDQHTLSPQSFIGFLIIFSQILSPIKSLTQGYYDIQKGFTAAERIFEVLNFKIDYNLNQQKISKILFKKEIIFDNVTFSYGEKKILDNICLNIKKGSKVAIVGESGSGKSSLINLLPRLYELHSGSICFDNININHFKVKNLRDEISLVTQDPILFNDTIFNNISLGGQNVNYKQVENAAKIANAHEFIMKKEDTYQYVIGESGNKLSGGEKQRISIARAIIKNPSILILDEATSALDLNSEELVQKAINNLMINRTSIIIAHRLSSIIDADKICVLKNGKIVEEGSHKFLMENKSYYYNLNSKQKL